MMVTSSDKKPLLIYLADLVHNYVAADIWVAPLNVASIAAYLQKEMGCDVVVELFKFPDDLIARCEESFPDILGLANYLWNYELVCHISRVVKRRSPGTMVVMGGPNATLTAEWMQHHFGKSDSDFYVSWAGEIPFAALVRSALDNDGDIGRVHCDPNIHGLWHRRADTGAVTEIPTRSSIKNLDDIPSPYLTGLLDSFIRDRGLIPLIETTRGCPYKCTFCDWGVATMGKVTHFSVERVKAEIAHCAAHSRDERITFGDANFGMLKDHNLEIAKYLRHLRDTTGYPGKVIMTWTQAKSDLTFQIADLLRDMSMMSTSSQSLDLAVLRNIKRHNISADEYRRLVKFCREKGIDSYGEVILPLPGETMAGFLDGLRFLFDAGVDFLNINGLNLLEGAEMNTPAQRREYGMRTKWRLLENCYGVYWDEAVVESQEMVVATKDFSESDYMSVRTLSWLIQMSWNLRRHEAILKVMRASGINLLDFFMTVLERSKTAPPPVAALFEDFAEQATSEMFDDKDDMIAHFSSTSGMDFLKSGGFSKMNAHYASRVSMECPSLFIDYYAAIMRQMIEERGILTDSLSEIVEDAVNFDRARYLMPEDLFAIARGESVGKILDLRFDAAAFISGDFGRSPEDYRGARFHYIYSTNPEQRQAIADHCSRFDGHSDNYVLRKLQEPLHGIHRKHLAFQLTPG